MASPYEVVIRPNGDGRWYWALLVEGAPKVEGAAWSLELAERRAAEAQFEIEWNMEGIDLAELPQAPPLAP